MTRVKICGIRSEEELKAAVAAGADAVGFQLGQLYPSDGFILSSTAQRLAAALPPYVAAVLVTHLDRASDILELVAKSGITTIQLHHYHAEETAKLRDGLPPGAKIIQTVYAAKLLEYDDLENFYPLVDAFDLDCFHASETAFESGDGSYHETAVADFLHRSMLPVILSGNLDAERAAGFVRKFRPYGVDSCRSLRDASDALDPAAVAEFVRGVRRADLEQ